MSARRARPILGFLALLVACTSSAALPRHAVAQQCAGPGPQTMLCLLNAERARDGLHELRLDRRLSLAAEAHSRDMVARRYFQHVTPSGERLAQRVERTGWLRRRPRWALGETLGWDAGALAEPAAMVAMWMHSPPHRRIVLRPEFRRVGIGITPGTPFGPAAEGTTFTADFGAGRRVVKR